jgi:hypothetical protein
VRTVTTKRWFGSPLIAALLGIAFASLSSSCGGSTPSATVSTPSAVATPTTAASPPTPAGSPPPGGAVPAKLLGNWFIPPAVVIAAEGASNCPSPPTVQNCFIQLNLTATEYHVSLTQSPTGSGNVVVNKDEIDFFNGGNCGLQLPEGVGRYKWTLTSGVLHLARLNQDPCGRDSVLINQWRRTA